MATAVNLVVPIELISTFIVRPFSLAVRLFANMLAGHILLVTFSVLTITLFTASFLIVVWPFSFFMLVAFTGFEVMVAFLQAYIFTLLTAVYIGGAIHLHWSRASGCAADPKALRNQVRSGTAEHNTSHTQGSAAEAAVTTQP